MGRHQCTLIIRSCKWLDIISFIRTLHDVLRYLGIHWHQWWDCLTLVNDIHQWSVIQWLLSMFDIDTFIHMVRIVPSIFVAGEDYIFCMTPSAILQQHTLSIWEYHSSTFISHILIHTTKQQFRSFTSHSIIRQQQPHSYCISSSTFWVSGGILFSKYLIM